MWDLEAWSSKENEQKEEILVVSILLTLHIEQQTFKNIINIQDIANVAIIDGENGNDDKDNISRTIQG